MSVIIPLPPQERGLPQHHPISINYCLKSAHNFYYPSQLETHIHSSKVYGLPSPLKRSDNMGKKFQQMTASHQSFIKQQKLFFAATATADSRINLSPKGIDTLRIINENRVLWLNLTGSANETAAHLLEDERMTLMFCSFEGSPLILRLYGQAKSIHPWEAEWEPLISQFPPLPGTRQIIDMQVDLVHSSCGMGVPFFDYAGERDQLLNWAEKKGEQGVLDYQLEKNSLSLDNKPTGITPPSK